MPRWLLDLVLIVLCFLGGIAFAPDLPYLDFRHAAPAAEPTPEPATIVQYKTAPGHDEGDVKMIVALRAQLAQVKEQLAAVAAKVPSETDNGDKRAAFTCMDGKQMTQIYELARAKTDKEGEVMIKKMADDLDTCIRLSAHTPQLDDGFKKQLQSGKL